MRRRLLEQAVAENLDTIRGLPPRALRRPKRLLDVLLRWSPVFLVAFTLTASTFFISPEPLPSLPSPGAVEDRRPRLSGQARRLSSTTAASAGLDTVRVAAAAFPLAVRRVVLDAGHGGTDPGASALGIEEKNVTLDIGRRLRRMLEQNGFEVVVTRGDDQTIKLRERARLANSSRSDVFVSIHVNSIVKYTASHGVETYYLGPTNDPSLTRLAAAENSSSGYSMADLRKLLDSIYADARRDESLQLATTVQQELYAGLRVSDPGLENWGVKRAPFVVLVATDMPAILAEVGCLSNDREAAMLSRADYRQKIAEALFHGIHAYAGAAEAPQKKGT
ncbi:MAG TPA: N-acetylmuramoyl-L-alanine amidase [Thermoanaerobaculia bacterium]|nr:N-acetylmuramoyl-L-alanine amidase [Thermoanaerobaculia bacterium]